MQTEKDEDKSKEQKGLKMTWKLLVKICSHCWLFMMAIFFNGIATSAIYPVNGWVWERTQSRANYLYCST